MLGDVGKWLVCGALIAAQSCDKKAETGSAVQRTRSRIEERESRIKSLTEQSDGKLEYKIWARGDSVSRLDVSIPVSGDLISYSKDFVNENNVL